MVGSIPTTGTMEIGGYDTIIETDDPQAKAEEIKAFVNWKDAVVEIVESDSEDYFWYKDQASKELWDELGCVPAAEDTMIYFLFDDKQLTLVTDKELTDQIRQFLEAEIMGVKGCRD